jgi:hypothetical protein
VKLEIVVNPQYRNRIVLGAALSALPFMVKYTDYSSIISTIMDLVYYHLLAIIIARYWRSGYLIKPVFIEVEAAIFIDKNQLSTTNILFNYSPTR